MSTFYGYQFEIFRGQALAKTLKTGSALLLILVSGLAGADTLELADGAILEGDFVGSSNGIVMFNAGDSVEALSGKIRLSEST